MKKRILFVMDSLAAAGGEKSLVTLLNELDYSRVDVDLQLMVYGGEFDRYVPSQVNILPPLDYLEFLSGKKSGGISMWCSRIRFSLLSRVGDNRLHMTKARKWWRCGEINIPVFSKEYDVAIAYAQCIPTFYVIEKVKARKKIGWVNCIFHLAGKEKQWQHKFYQMLDKIVMVSEDALSHFEKVYPDFQDKMLLIRDLISANTIYRLSEEDNNPFKDDFTPRLLTVARLDKKDKGYDIALEACRILKDRGVAFKWYAIGRGDFRSTIEKYVEEHHLKDTFILLGTTPNPYPYFKHCTIYVQTSRHEGFGLSIAEARILNKPVVTTEFDSVYVQMVPSKNGLVVPIDAIAVADAVQKLLEDKSLYESIVDYQRHEKKGNIEEIDKFYHLIDC